MSTAIVPARAEHRDAFLCMCRTLHAESGAAELAPFDEDALAHLFAQSIEWNLLSSKFSAGDGRILIALDDEQPVGVIAVILVPVFFSPATLVAHELLVWLEPTHRGRGLGRDLFAAALEWARDAGAHAMSIGAMLTGAIKRVAVIAEELGFTELESTYVRRL